MTNSAVSGLTPAACKPSGVIVASAARFQPMPIPCLASTAMMTVASFVTLPIVVPDFTNPCFFASSGHNSTQIWVMLIAAYAGENPRK